MIHPNRCLYQSHLVQLIPHVTGDTITFDFSAATISVGVTYGNHDTETTVK